MDRWELVVQNYTVPSINSFRKALQMAAEVFKEDLADFEIEWITQTLLYEPVCLLKTVCTERQETWHNCIINSYKLLESVMPKLEEIAEHIFEDIVKACLSSHDAATRGKALNCLSSLCKISTAATPYFEQFVNELETTTVCKAALAELIGTICEYHPSDVTKLYNNVLRLFLNLLNNKKNTATVTVAYLQGILGLFRHYSDRLPAAEIKLLYTTFFDALDIDKNGVVLKFLEEHSDLFTEYLAQDSNLRLKLWGTVPSGNKTIVKVYKNVFGKLKDLNIIENVLQKEVRPYLDSYQTKYTALRVWHGYVSLGGHSVVTEGDTGAIEWGLRTGDNVVMEASYCIDCGVPNSERLLQTAILYYQNIPQKYIKDIIIYPLMRAAEDVRKASIYLLASESCSNTNYDNYAPLWRQLLADDGQDPMMDSSKIFGDFMEYLQIVVEGFLEDDDEVVPTHLHTLCSLTSLILDTQLSCASSLPNLLEVLRRELRGEGVRVVRHLGVHAGEVDEEFYKMLSVDRCKGEELLCECCLAFIYAPDGCGDIYNIVIALQIIFSRTDVDIDSYRTALKKCQYLLTERTDKLDCHDVGQVIKNIEKLYNRTDLVCKESRILKREIFFFLGKFGNIAESTLKNDYLKENLILNLKNLEEGFTYKLKLDEILEHAIISGDSDILLTLLTVMCANDVSSDVSRICRVCVAWCRASVATPSVDVTPVLQALKLSKAAICLLPYIAEERSPGVRGILKDVLEMLLSDTEIIHPVAEQGLAMLRLDSALKRQAGLDIIQSVIKSIETNHSLLKSILPKSIISITSTTEHNTITALEVAIRIFLESSALFDSETSIDLIVNIIKNMSNVKCQKTVKMTVNFIKNVASEKKINSTVFLNIKIKTPAYLVFLCELNKVFCFDFDFKCQLLEINDLLEFDDDLKDDWIEAVLCFLGDFVDVFLDKKKEETIKLISYIITRLTPNTIINTNKTIIKTLKIYENKLKCLPLVISQSFQNWSSVLPISQITTDLVENKIDQHKNVLKSLKVMLEFFKLDNNFIKTWPILIMNYNGMETETPILRTALSISLKCLNINEIKDILNKNGGVQFCRSHIRVFFDVLVSTPCLFDDVTLLDDVITCYIQMRCPEKWSGDVMRLVVELWPKYEKHCNFTKKHLLLLNLTRMPVTLSTDLPPIKWGLDIMEKGDVNQKILLLRALPTGDEYSHTYRSLSSILPGRLSEVTPSSAAALTACIEAAHSADLTLLKTIANLAAGDDTKGWWDEAIDTCMAAIANKRDVIVYDTVYGWSWQALSMGVCDRMFVPLLRYTSTRFLEEYISKKLNDLMKILTTKKMTNNTISEECIVNYTRTFKILTVVFEKLPKLSLESSNSILHSGLENPESWMLVRRTCKLCVTLRGMVGMDGGYRMKIYRTFHTSAYICLATAICRWGQSKAYPTLFEKRALSMLIDNDKTYKLPIKPKWNRRIIRKQISSDLETGNVGSCISTVRSRPLLRTLSDNPLHYDLLDIQEDEETTTQECQMTENELNQHEVSLSLSIAVLRVTSCRDALRSVAAALSGDAAMLVAQAICNRKSDLQANSDILIQPLLKFTMSTTVKIENDIILNGLHIDVLNTIIEWKNETPYIEEINLIVKLLIKTGLHYRQNKLIFETVVDCLDRLLVVYGQTVTVECDVFPDYLSETTPDDIKMSCLKLFQILTKHKIYIEKLLPNITTMLANTKRQHESLPKLFGQTLAICSDSKMLDECLAKYQRILDGFQKKNISDYIKLLYYSQMGCNKCCKVENFRYILSKTSKLPTTDKQKCLRIICRYIQGGCRNDDITNIMSTLDIEELLTGDCAKDILNIITSSLAHHGNNDVMRPAVMTSLKYCDHPSDVIREAATEMAKVAFEKLINNDKHYIKRRKINNTAIIRALENDDVYNKAVMKGLGQGTIKDIEGLSNNIHDRFVESFFLSLYLPILHNTRPISVTSLVANFTRMLFSMRSQGFRSTRLRDEALTFSDTTRDLSSLTAVKTYHGTFRSLTHTYTQTNRQATPTGKGLNVQMTIDEVLEDILKFCKTNTTSSVSLCVQLSRELRTYTGCDFDDILSRYLATLLGFVSGEYILLIVELCRVFVDVLCKMEGVISSVEDLLNKCKGSEGEDIIRLLYDELLLNNCNHDYFVLGSFVEQDVNMTDLKEFSIDGLKSTFGRLSSWDDMTIQQRGTETSLCPSLFTDYGQLERDLERYQIGTTWFDKMLVLHRGIIKDSVMWQRGAEKWPRKQFMLSAISEAIEWGYNSDTYQLYSYVPIRRKDCMAEWAARLMIRSVHLSSSSDVDGATLLRKSEVKWCLSVCPSFPQHLIQCIDRMKRQSLNVEEVPNVLLLKLKLNKDINSGNNEVLNELIMKTEKHIPIILPHATTEVYYEVYEALLQLRGHIDAIDQQTLDDVMHNVDKKIKEQGTVSCKSKNAINSIYECSFIYYNDIWTRSDENNKKSILVSLLDLLIKVTNIQTDKLDSYVAIILNCLDDLNIIDDYIDILLDKCEQLLPTLKEWHKTELMARLSSHKASFGTRIHLTSRVEFEVEAEKFKGHLRLICDPEYTLALYCSDLEKAVDDPNEWKRIFEKIKNSFFECDGGSEYLLLQVYKNDLCSIEDYAKTSKETKSKTLLAITKSAILKPFRATLRVSQLSARLRHDIGATAVLHLPSNLTVVSIDDEVQVMQSIRRPCVVRALLCNGTARRWLVKRDLLSHDVAATRLMNTHTNIHPPSVYTVSLLDDDCGLIEFLEDHRSIRQMIATQCDLDKIAISRPRDEELLQEPTHRLALTHKQNCSKIPATVLRSALQDTCYSSEEFVNKKQWFQDSLAIVTIFNWIFDVGDRHCENLHVDQSSGAVCGIDWALMMHRNQQHEPAPARLTRTLIALCDRAVFESRLQTELKCLREKYKLYMPIVLLHYKKMTQYQEKISNLKSILEGKTTSVEISLKTSSQRLTDLLNEVFYERKQKEHYTVQEQVEVLLRHCTDDRVLGATRAGWEPWL